jgi:hypothetical protein
MFWLTLFFMDDIQKFLLHLDYNLEIFLVFLFRGDRGDVEIKRTADADGISQAQPVQEIK